jgi:electron transfer flavoprotein alpha subunit
MGVLVIAEHDDSALAPGALNTIGAAFHVSESVSVLVAGYRCRAVAEQAAGIPKIQKILLTDAPHYESRLAETLTELIVSLAARFTHIMAPATGFGKNLLPRVAAKLDVAQISDIVEVKSADIFVRPLYAGNVLTTVQSRDATKVITVRPTAFEAVSFGAGTAPIETIPPGPDFARTKLIGRELTQSARPDLASARIVVSGGRGLGSGENFKRIEQLADKLGAAVGASRAAVDAGFVPNDFQIGQTGKVVAPNLYIAIGISGAIQHLAGMTDSKIVVAINKDPDAPIFESCDYVWVADWEQAIPELMTALEIN